MAISYNPAKRDRTLEERGLDFADAARVIDGPKYQFLDDRLDYGEERITTVGFLDDDMVVVVWTRRDEDFHIISMRKASRSERKKYKDRMG